ncbi:MAG: nicotinate-nucleotide--dimethylbenzimidazole phosphoribosyltransferase [Alphaproteobacteria bacterium]|nr:nicotinate-nucleotide--dimethylbenzimidazole phosphoribosyltransferase [Alphaproteobacteria bacterium]MBU1277667.1 nicotinate-nucleotide--dimethylbenzimidazole phosphoribosyltransferase [Alphaproteobacteria bacterium]MBU1574536.1 nicotinate-nucleotide--dimethylbenzimidazole phosphoribosyltransferase [Alphaproteobacteria bacterium]MBU1827246.1 nicotinate-nucleotide--dimethylbenzimidazole phosphoribosyltransferase [Alphaproteobacteria bacterium]MBU2079928.1 nicotinate-nucleotide--dimethylbenzi
MDFSDLAGFERILKQAPGPDMEAQAAATARNAQLTKPAGSLGRLEEIGIWYAAWRGEGRPRIEKPQVAIFAGNHGVTARGVSAFPVEVTVQMVANFQQGGAAINQLARNAGASMSVHALDLDRPTGDFTETVAMSEEDCVRALKTGWDAVNPQADLLVVGEMGIGNTTSAAAMANALFGGTAADWVGRGTGVDDAGLKIKEEVCAAGVALHGGKAPLAILASLGGREVAAMAGAIARARVLRIPVILDGFICCAAAACLEKAVPGALDHCIAGHQSAEAAHRAVLKEIGKEPLVSLGLRLGEGSGAGLVIPLVKGAVECLSGMATFAEAGVSAG